MSDKNVIKGINLISKHIPKGSCFDFAAEHDIIYYGDYDWVKGLDRAKLKRWGWFEDEESWAHHV